MDITKKLKSIANWQEKAIIFFFLVVFPFGQLLRIEVSVAELSFPILAVDVIAIISLIRVLVVRQKMPPIAKYFLSFWVVGLFSLVMSFTVLSPSITTKGFLYLVRLLSYGSLFLVSIKALNGKYKNNQLKSLLAVCIFVAIFGWIQYFFYPNLTSLAIYGWDDHLYRMTSTFLDPGYTSIILVFGFLVSVSNYLNENKKMALLLVVLLALSVAFTYARAGYLALIAGVIALGVLTRKIKFSLIATFLFLVTIYFLPKPGGEGVDLTRTASIGKRLANYQETREIIKISPALGIGFNNICAYKKKLPSASTGLHSCSGADSSILFVLATTGVVGFIVFLDFGKRVFNHLGKDNYSQVFVASIVALVVHSFFLNSMFYVWVMGYLAILYSLAIKKS